MKGIAQALLVLAVLAVAVPLAACDGDDDGAAKQSAETTAREAAKPRDGAPRADRRGREARPKKARAGREKARPEALLQRSAAERRRRLGAQIARKKLAVPEGIPPHRRGDFLKYTRCVQRALKKGDTERIQSCKERYLD